MGIFTEPADPRHRAELLVVVACWLAILGVVALGITVGIWLYGRG